MTPEEIRLDESRERRTKHWKRWGPYLSERAWGTVREDYSPDGTAWEYFPHDHARSRAYRWNEDGLAGHLAIAISCICFAAGALERPRPDPEGAPVRPDRQRGQPRRGRQGVLLLPRQHADALLHEVPLQVPAGARSPTRSSSRRTGGAASDEPEFELLDTGVFDDDRYFDVFVEYAKADVGRHPDPDHASTNRGPEAAPLRSAADALVPQHLVVGPRRRRSRALARSARSRRAIALDRARCSGRRWLYCEGPARAAVHRERDQHRSGCSASRTGRRYVKDGINDYVVHGDARRGESRADGHEGRGALSARRSAPGETVAVRLRLTTAASTAAAAARSTRLRRDLRRPQAEADEFYATVIPADAVGRRDERDAAGVRRAALVEAVLPLRRQDWLEGDPGAAAAAGRATARPQPRVDAPLQRRRHLDAGQVGVSLVRRLGPGVPLRAAGAGRSGVRQGAARAAAARVVHAPERPAPRVRVGVRRRQPAGARLGRLARLQDRAEAPRRRRPRRSSSASSTSCC